MKQKRIRNILSIALSIFLVLGMVPISAVENTVVSLAGESAGINSAAAIENDWSWMTVNDTKANTTIINFAGNEWYVVGYNGSGVATTSGAITLFSTSGFGANAKFNNTTTGVQNQYINSNLRNELTTGTRFTGIDERERSMMVSRLLDGVAGEQPTDQLWALSTDEATALNSELRTVGGWGLRTQGANNYSVMIVDAYNKIVSTYVTSAFAVRPAFNLNLESVLFASAAVGGKATDPGQELSAVTAPGQKAKLTVIDSNTANLNLMVEQDIINTIKGKTYASGDTVEIAYSGAKTAANKYVSCVIADSEGRVIHYGKLSQAESGTVNFTVPALVDGNYTINLFNEECSTDSDKKSDYASEPIAISITVEKPVATYTVTLPTDMTGYTVTAQDGSTSPVKSGDSYSFKVELATEYSKSKITVKANGTPVTPIDGVYTISNITEEQTVTVEGVKLNPVRIPTDWSWMTVNDTKAKTTVINFAGNEWYVVGYNGSGVASTPGAITLFSTANFGTNVAFNSATVTGNEYYKSILRKELTEGTRFTEIDEREKSVMVSRLLDGVAGTQPSDKLWALSYNEAAALNISLRATANNTSTYLRSPVDGTNNKVWLVIITNILYEFQTLTSAGGVRPAFNLNLESVLFASAAEGGKAATTGQEMSAMTAPGQKVKLTMMDSSTDNLNLTVEQTVIDEIKGRTYAPGDTVEIAYSDAKTAANKYVSCVIMDGSGKVTHYGKLSDQANGTAVLTVPTLANGSYTVKLFNEECNGDKITDYTSEPVEIQITVEKPLEQSLTITLPTGTGYTAIAQSGSSSPVNRGGSYSFKVELAPEYNQSVITVKANDTTLTPDGDGVYTISNITEHQSITVTGVKQNTIPTATATLNIQKDDAVWSGHGKSYTLKLSTDENKTAKMTGTGGTVKVFVPYGTWKIYEGSDYTGATITVESTGGTATLNYYTVKFSVIDADISK